MKLLQLEVEGNAVGFPPCLDTEGYHPPSRHAELHSFHKVGPIAIVLRDLGLRRHTMTVFGHSALNRDLSILDRLAINGLDLEFPGLEHVHRNSLGITCVCSPEYSRL